MSVFAGGATALRKARHPSGLELTFDPKWHTYKFLGKRLTSVSRILGKYFPFDTQRVAAMVAEKELKTVDQVLAEWRMSTVLGSNVHAHIESLLLGEPRRPVGELQGDEQRFYPAATVAAHSILAQYEVLAVEAMVCSPKLRIAGTIDFLGRNRKTGAIAVLDWKTTAAPLAAFRFGTFDEPCPAPLGHLTNAKATKYALQVLTYGHILRTEGYSKFYGKALDEQPIEYGIVQVGLSSDAQGVAPEFSRVVPELLLPADGGADYSPETLLATVLRW